jgi:5-methylcytosine-specific restriction endonuclease McrA
VTAYRVPTIKLPIAARSTFTVPKLQKQAADHYATPEHREWRKQIIARAGGMCEKCGRDDGRLYADHIRAVQDGGDLLDLANGQALCDRCHKLKTYQERAMRR